MDNLDTWLHETLPGQATLTAALFAIVVWGMWAILTGRLFSGKAMQMMVDEKNKWQEAYEKERDAHFVTLNSLNNATDALKTTEKVINAIPEAGDSS